MTKWLSLIGNVTMGNHPPVSACFATRCAVCFVVARTKVSGGCRSTQSCLRGRTVTWRPRASKSFPLSWPMSTFRSRESAKWSVKHSFQCKSAIRMSACRTYSVYGRRTLFCRSECRGSRTWQSRCTSRLIKSQLSTCNCKTRWEI